MSNKEILEKALQKAIDGGWQKMDATPGLTIESYAKWLNHAHNYMLVIFNHDFAKSLWPTQASGSVDPGATSPGTARPLIPTWQARLMEMVVAPDPIAYLGEHLGENI